MHTQKKYHNHFIITPLPRYKLRHKKKVRTYSKFLLSFLHFSSHFHMEIKEDPKMSLFI